MLHCYDKYIQNYGSTLFAFRTSDERSTEILRISPACACSTPGGNLQNGLKIADELECILQSVLQNTRSYFAEYPWPMYANQAQCYGKGEGEG